MIHISNFSLFYHNERTNRRTQELAPDLIQSLQDLCQQRKLSEALDALKDCEIYGDDALEVLGAIAPVSEEVDL